MLSFSVVLLTLVLQGLTLAPLIRWLGLRDDGEEARELTLARRAALDASVRRLDEMKAAGGGGWDPEFTAVLRAYYAGSAAQLRSTEKRDARALREQREQFLSGRAALTEVQRHAVVALWREGRITDQSLALALRQVDMQHLMFTPDAG